MDVSRGGALEVTALLLSAGASRTLKDKAGLSASDHASQHSYSTLFKFMGQQVIH